MRLCVPLFALILLACETGPRPALLPPDVPPPPVEEVDERFDTADAAPDRDECWATELCTCADGRRGEIECRSGDAYCNCDICPWFEPREAAPSEACGGAPIGSWRATTSDFRSMNLVIYSGFEVIESCPVHIASQSDQYDLRFVFREGGDATVSVSGPTLEFNIEDSCAPGSCEDLGALGAGSLQCTEGECGICECEMIGPRLAVDGAWERADGVLSIDVNASLLYEAEYCVNGPNSMLVHDPTGVVIEMEKVVGTGSPTPCRARDPEVCTVNGQCSFREDTGCYGLAPSECGLEDYDIVPGCRYVSVSSVSASASPTGWSSRVSLQTSGDVLSERWADDPSPDSLSLTATMLAQ